ncbi:hypothetical protein [Winogradskyella sp.]|uniref:hypothetical protein n=1 Tax=Winogradskyella sp. TaxID=1883156 RepID=UPI0025F9A102|nr:hypothetical protein [Winogradskyella sp.]
MKTNFSYALSVVLLCFFMQLNAQSEFFSDLSPDNKEIKAEDFTNLDTDYILEDFQFYMENKPEMSEKVFATQVKPEDLLFAVQMLAIGVGFGFGENETQWCFHAAYHYKLRQFQRSALYAALGFAYSGFNFNDQKQSLIDIQLKLLMFHAISKFNEIRLIYGILGAYGFGNEKYNSFTTDITRVTLALVMGFQLMLATKWTLALHTNILTHTSRTFKPENGGEFKDNFTNVLINKSNLLTLSLLFNFGK